jgi:hypothetical protein
MLDNLGLGGRSSFSEEKEAKRLCAFGVRGGNQRAAWGECRLGTRRIIAAFVIAPLAVPALVGALGELSAFKNAFEPIPDPHVNQHMIIDFTTTLAALSYGGAILFGVPAYLWLRKRRVKTFWAWPALGFAGGAATVLVLALGIALRASRDPNPDHFPRLPEALVVIPLGMVLAGFFGALVGVAHRIIAPPPAAP